jgi:hypothetical protein
MFTQLSTASPKRRRLTLYSAWISHKTRRLRRWRSDSLRLQEDEKMGSNTSETPIPETRRKEIFHALVEAQDTGLDVIRSRRMIAEKFETTEMQVQVIEREGLDHHWPPL